MTTHQIQSVFKRAAAIEMNRLNRVEGWKHFGQAGEHTRDTQLNQRSSGVFFDKQDRIGSAIPALFHPPCNTSPAQKPSLIIVRPEECCTRMRNLYGDNR